jgi:hypothetical protein
MDDLDVATTTTDVAAFLRAELPEIEEKRRKVVTQSVEEARGREHTPTPVMNVDDDPYAPTLLGDRARLPGARDAGGRASSGQAADDEPLVIPHHSRAWFWVLLTLVAGVAGLRFAKPALFGELLGRIGLGSAMAWLAPQGASPAASESAPVVAPSASSLAVLAAADASVTAGSSGPVAAHGLASPGPSTSHPPPHASASASAGTALDGGVLTVLPAVSVTPGAASSASSASAAPSPSPSAAAMASSPPVASAAPPSTAPAPAEQAPVDASESPSPY